MIRDRKSPATTVEREGWKHVASVGARRIFDVSVRVDLLAVEWELRSVASDAKGAREIVLNLERGATADLPRGTTLDGEEIATIDGPARILYREQDATIAAAILSYRGQLHAARREPLATHRDGRVEIMSSWEHLTDNGLRDHLHAVRMEIEALSADGGGYRARLSQLARYVETVRDVLQYRIVQAAAERGACVGAAAAIAESRSGVASEDADGRLRWVIEIAVDPHVVCDGFNLRRMAEHAVGAGELLAMAGRSLGHWRPDDAVFAILSAPSDEQIADAEKGEG